MRIGIDFDNTIADYEGVFHRAALERGLLGDGVGTTKNEVRDHLNGRGDVDAFTELQGHVYGARMDLAKPYAGVAAFIRAARAAGHELFVISHKTKTPLLGEAHDMHAAARGFLADNGLVGDDMIAPNDVYFEVTKELKVGRAATLEVDAFIDDLPEILTMGGLPSGARKVLFDPVGAHADGDWPFDRVARWDDIARLLLAG